MEEQTNPKPEPKTLKETLDLIAKAREDAARAPETGGPVSPIKSGDAVKSPLNNQRPCPNCQKARMSAIHVKLGVDEHGKDRVPPVSILCCPWCGLKVRAFDDVGGYFTFGEFGIDLDEIKKNGGYTYGPPPMKFEALDASFSTDGTFKRRQIKQEADWDWTKAAPNPSADFEEYLSIKRLTDSNA